MAQIHDAARSWVKDGSETETPVTASTPEIVETVETPAVVEAVTSTDVATPETPAVVAPAAETPVEATPAEVQAQIEYLEARLGDEPFQIPKNVALPWKRGNETGFAPITEVLASTMMEKDYRQKTQTVAAEKRTVEAEKARLAAERALFLEERGEFESALKDPEKLQHWQNHYDQMTSNPVYRQNVEDARAKRMTDAELDVYRASEERQVIEETTQNLYTTIVELGSQYQGVDPERVRTIYAERLVAGAIPEITLDSIHQVYKQEADYTLKVVSPLRGELDALKAELDTLKASRATVEHNAKTDAAIARTKGAPIVAAVGTGAPPGIPAKKPAEPFTSNQYPDRIKQWVSAR